MKLQLSKMKLVRFSVIVMAIVGQTVGTGGRSGSQATNYRSSPASYETERAPVSTFEKRDNSFTSSGFSRSAISAGFPREVSQNEAPQPYNFNYESADEQGNSHYHRAEADASGTVRGSYGYTDIQGLYRVVDYIADVNGYRASIRSNEPGTDGKESPADVQMIVEQPPFGIQERYNPFAGTGAGAGGIGPAVGRTYESGMKPKEREESDEYEEDKDNKS
ncbi:uncharacterized protein LOC129967053 isoform X2 [Argiope bruennichi]|nr:uncharacterized protein LOC129967053 isoform X2 [Argiope bruennichi]